MSDRFVYVTYIRTTPEKLWDALTKPEFTRAYWFGVTHDCDWRPGSPWRMAYADGRTTDAGEVLEAERPRRFVLSWRKEFMPEVKSEGYSRATFELEKSGSAVKLTVTHEMDREGSKLIEGVSNGWPHILASLKSLLETGESLEETREWRVCETR